MAKNMPGRSVSRPAQGQRSASMPPKNPRPAYRPDAAPKIVSTGSQSQPKKRDKWAPTLRNTDTTPKIIQS